MSILKRLPRIAWFFVLITSLACSFTSSVLPSPTGSVVPDTTTETPPIATPLPPAEGVIAYSSDRNGFWQIVAMNADGSDEVSLTSSPGAYSRPSWSPDGQKIAMRMEIEMGSGIAVMDVRRENGRLLGAPPVELLKAFADGPRWSPDGTKLVYVASAAGGWIVYNLDVATTSSVGVPGIPENSTDPDWSPDGQQIVFAYYADSVDQMNDLYVINTDGSGLTQLTNTPNINEGEARWSPDGQKIVFTTFERLESGDINKDIFIMHRDGTNITRLTTDPEQDFDPSWSPDGKQIVFVSDRHESNDGNYEIYVINTDGTGELRLTNNRSTDRWPTWRAKQPDDVPVTNCQPAITLIADVTIPAGTRFAAPQPFTKIWRVKNSGTCTWTPTDYLLRFGEEGEQMGGAPFVRIPGAIQPGATVDLALPLVAPEAPGRHVSHWKVFGRDGNAVPGPDGNPVTLTVDIEVLAAGQTVLPQPLYFLSEQSGSSQIWRMETDARTVKQITNEPQPVLTLDISASGRIAYVSQYQVFVTDANGQDRQVIATLESDALPRKLAWSPDGNRLAYPSKGIHVYDMTTGEDKLLIADKDTQAPDLVRYEPLEWSPDGSKLTLTKYLWESLGINVISTSNGAVLFDQAQQDITWNRDSQSVYLSSPYYSEWTGLESGLWRGLTTGEAPQPLLQGASIWLPVHRADGTLAFFMHQPTTQETKEFTPLLYVSAADGTDPVAVNFWPIMIGANDTFNGVWTEDGQSILIQLVRPALNVSEVLLLTADEKPPVFLTSEPKAFWWGE